LGETQKLCAEHFLGGSFVAGIKGGAFGEKSYGFHFSHRMFTLAQKLAIRFRIAHIVWAQIVFLILSP
jgi:hypothetical protein